jgi:hypothetical protein
MDAMGIAVVVTKNVLEPLPDGGTSFGLRDPAARAVGRQPESTLSAGIDPVGTTVFNRGQVSRLLQEFRALARQSDQRTRQDLEDAAVFIEAEMAAIGAGLDCYVVFLGD